VSIFIESRYKVTFGDQNWKLTIRFEVIQVTTLRVSAKARSHVAIFMKSKRNEVTTINIVQTQVEKMYFICNIKCRHAALSRGIPHGLPTKSQCSTNPKNPSEMSETQWSYTLHISLNQGKLDGPFFCNTLCYELHNLGH
jgi:hypothetical protein